MDDEPWEWRGNDDYLHRDPQFDISWEHNEQDLSYMFCEATPIKACGDLAYCISDDGKKLNKEKEEYKESSSQVKRRRMLQFGTHPADSLYCDEQMPPAFMKLKGREDLMEETAPDGLQWAPGFSEGRCGNEGVDKFSESWISNCFSGDEMHFNSDDMNVSGDSSDQIDISEFCNIPPEMETDMVQDCPTPARPRVFFKGRKSFMRTPTKMASSIVYPFALIKPCAVQGDVTLKDINQRIRTPPPSKSNDKDDDATASYPTSAFSGKPVVVKTKIRTEGGKGSITIMRTKG
ncbi:hypothetical protein Scep_029078 [Stephania cephalantha]|uniref:Protein XRI1 n=1 Tax=Stephania cephalantha TaxID=152367 RepID=A0AAP0E1F4_9MAGN